MYKVWLTVLGAGYSPLIPGTCGSAVVGALFLLVVYLGATPTEVTVLMLAVAAHGLVVTVVYGDRLIARYGEDPRLIVSDEQCGQALSYLCYLWLGQTGWPLKDIIVFAAAGFVLFRAFDIIKPPPVRQLDRIKGGWGVVLDDVMAGVYTNIALQIFWWAWQRMGQAG